MENEATPGTAGLEMREVRAAMDYGRKTSLVYIEKDGRYLILHRTKKGKMFPFAFHREC